MVLNHFVSSSGGTDSAPRVIAGVERAQPEVGVAPWYGAECHGRVQDVVIAGERVGNRVQTGVPQDAPRVRAQGTGRLPQLRFIAPRRPIAFQDAFELPRFGPILG